MKLKNFILIIALAVAGAMNAQMMPEIPADPAFRIGKLENGLTYYIRKNAYPENTANFYIAQKVGSIQEEDNQRGLAHFLEHMAFNGSTHFKGDKVLDFTRSLGVSFGGDLNAYTSIEETVYRVCNVPTARQTALDSCLLILQDWSNGLDLLSEEIDKERGVIHGEWAMRNSATQRLFEKNLPLMYPGSKYGYRMPIGTMEVVDNFTPEALRDYYRKWYHPENQAIIVVGDIDVDHTEAEIKKVFSGIKAGENVGHVTPVEVPNNNEPIYIVDKDKEMQYTMMEMLVKTDPMPREMRATGAIYAQGYMTSMAAMMFNSRMGEISQQPDCPFIQMSMGYGNYQLSSTKDASQFYAVPKEGKEKETMQALIHEAMRVKEFGFTASEYVRARDEFMSQAEKGYSNREKRKHPELYQQCVDNFLHGDAMPDPDTEYQLWQVLSQQLPLQVINQAAQELFTVDNDTNFVFYMFMQEKDGAKYFTTDEMKQIVDAARTDKLEAWVDNTKDEPLIAVMPKAGTIKKEKKNDTFGYTELTLSNGAKVILKKTDFKDDEVQLSGYAEGGSCRYGAEDFSNMKLYAQITNSFGLGNFNNTELGKALAGKQVGLGLSLGRNLAHVSGQSTPKDIETMFQLLYLHFTDVQKDEMAYNTMMQAVETNLKNRDLKPETQLSDSVSANVYCRNPRFANLTLDDLSRISYDRVIEITKENFTNVNGFTFVIIGNFDEEKTRELICQYIASLPGKGKKAKTTDVRTLFSGNINCDFTRKMETPKPYVYQIYKSETQNSLRNDILSTYVGEVLSMMLLKSVREDAGAAYSVSGSAYLNPGMPKEKCYVMLQVAAPISAPEKQDMAIELMNKDVESLAENCDPDMFGKVKENLLKDFDIEAKQNGHWMGAIQTYLMTGIDAHTDYKKTVESITPADVSAYLKNVILAGGNKLQVVMRPE